MVGSVATGLALRVALAALGLIAFFAPEVVQCEPVAPERSHFNIPSQPLLSALERYGDIAKRELLYDANLASGRLSTAVNGDYPAPEALEILLGGTELTARFPTETAVVIVPIPTSALNSPNSTSEDAAERTRFVYAEYYGLVQRRIKEAFCENVLLQPGPYRASAQIWISASGGVARTLLLDTTGDKQRDEAVAHALARLHIGAAPPAGLAQPFTLVVRPHSALGRDCRSLGRG